jgi:hypothetical protein
MTDNNFQGYKSEKTVLLDDLLRGKNVDGLNYCFIEGLHCGQVCVEGAIDLPFDETSPPDEAVRQLFKYIELNDSELKLCQSAIIDSVRGINAISTNKGFYFLPYWNVDVKNELDIYKYFLEAYLTGVGIDDILKKKLPDMYIVDNESKQSDNVRNWIEGFLLAFTMHGLIEKMDNDETFRWHLLVLESLKDNCYYFEFQTHPQPNESTLKLIDFYKLTYQIPQIVSELYSAIHLEGRFQSRPSSKRRNTHHDKKRHIKERLNRRRERRSGKGMSR